MMSGKKVASVKRSSLSARSSAPSSGPDTRDCDLEPKGFVRNATESVEPAESDREGERRWKEDLGEKRGAGRLKTISSQGGRPPHCSPEVKKNSKRVSTNERVEDV